MAERATIAPSLIHILNDSQSPEVGSKQLPQHAAHNLDSISLPPLGVDVRGHQRTRPPPQQIPSFSSITDDLPSRQKERADGPYRSQALATGGSTVLPPLQLPDDADSLQRPNRHLGYATDTNDDAVNKKRQRAATLRQDNSGPLPQPLKKQKSTQQVLPPVISGLHEPPENAAVLPPIRGGHFDDARGSNLDTPQDFTPAQAELPPLRNAHAETPETPEKSGNGRPKRTARKPRRKWTDEETQDLLLGVKKHGYGKWTKIVEDRQFNFDNRSAGDLKDRFRTCCPPELREELFNRKNGGTDEGGDRTASQTPSSSQNRQSIALDNILNDNILEEGADMGGRRKGPSSIASTSNDSDGGAPKPKTRAHRKNIEDLEALGIQSFKQSDRRPRRKFTEQEDHEILDGIKEHGASWTRIQADARYHLQSRKPTDLRDRVRNKYPDLYNSLEKGTSASISAGRTTTKILEPSEYTPGWNPNRPPPPRGFEPHLNRTASSETIARSMRPPPLPPPPPPSNTPQSSGTREPVDSSPGRGMSPGFDAPPSSFITTGEEMSISRLTNLNIEDAQSTHETRHRYNGTPDDLYPRAPSEQQPAASTQQQPEASTSSRRRAAIQAWRLL